VCSDGKNEGSDELAFFFEEREKSGLTPLIFLTETLKLRFLFPISNRIIALF